MSVKHEIDAYHVICAQVVGDTIYEQGLALFCASGVLPPNNRVTRCFGRFVSTLRATTVLDLGCGTGILAFLAARYADSVIGVDIDARAVACARYNAALNALNNVQFLLGDGYAPVVQRKFELILSNPPFYPATGTIKAPLSMCMRTDKPLLFSLIAGLPQHLEAGGRAFFVSSSLSDNGGVRDVLKSCKLDFKCGLLHRGIGASQDIYLWEVKAPYEEHTA